MRRHRWWQSVWLSMAAAEAVDGAVLGAATEFVQQCDDTTGADTVNVY